MSLFRLNTSDSGWPQSEAEAAGFMVSPLLLFRPIIRATFRCSLTLPGQVEDKLRFPERFRRPDYLLQDHG
jgi:hypothetical protein